MKKNIVLFIFLLLSAIGLEYETQAYTTGSMSGTSYGIVGLSALLALLYIIPALLLIRQLGKKWQTPALSIWEARADPLVDIGVGQARGPARDEKAA